MDFLLRPENEAVISGKRPLRRHRRLPIPQWVAGALLIMIGVWLAGGPLTMVWQGLRLNAASERTTGTVINRLTHRDVISGTETYALVYSYRVGGTTYEHTDGVGKDIHNSYAVDQAIVVEYLPANPQVARIILDEGSPGVAPSVTIVTAVFLIGLGVMILWSGAQSVRKRLEDRARGQVIEGQLLRSEGFFDRNDYVVVVDVVFTSPESGVRLVTTGSAPRRDLKEKPLPQPGDTAYVWHVSDKDYAVL